jgi:hypothetical protein
MPWWVQLPADKWKPGMIDKVEERSDEYVLHLKRKSEASYAVVFRRYSNMICVPDDFDVEILTMSGGTLLTSFNGFNMSYERDI